MVQIPAAVFRMGSDQGAPDERPAHEVRVATFQMDVTEVTVGLYSACVSAGGCVPALRGVQFPGVTAHDHEMFDSECNGQRIELENHPINCVDWAMADAYCRWAGKRLPTEEEWEYAACAGDCDSALNTRGGVMAIVRPKNGPITAIVGTSAPGPFGLYDMADNVWEWTSSPYCPYDHPDCGERRRVVRGGSWEMDEVLRVHLSDRSPTDPANRTANLGFRCAR